MHSARAFVTKHTTRVVFAGRHEPIDQRSIHSQSGWIFAKRKIFYSYKMARLSMCCFLLYVISHSHSPCLWLYFYAP